MSFTYFTTISRNIDRVRYLIGDTNEKDFQLHDGEISFSLSNNDDDVKEAAIVSARAIAAKFSKLADTKVGEESISYSKLSDQVWALADRLVADVSIRAGISGGGIAIEGIGGEDPAFTRKLHFKSIEIIDNTTAGS